MARPQKCGMDYFPHDTDALTDEKIEALRMLYGNDGYAFYFILLERIYRTEQFELDISDAETIQILSRKISVTEEQFNKMLCTALKRNCFDNEIYNDRKCLTSTGIKKRADVVISKRTASKKSYEKSISATETTQETNTETLQKVHKGKEIKEEKKKEKKETCAVDYDDIFNHYLKAGLINHKKLTVEMKKGIDTAIKNLECDTEEMKRMIDRHKEKSVAMKDNDKFKVRSLAEFFGQKKWQSVSLICSDYSDDMYKNNQQQTGKKELIDDNPFNNRGAV